jgi:O-antigen chain-terminating methyltransferase
MSVGADLYRLRRERDQADRAYNDALTALDGAIQRLRELPLPPPEYDEHQITPLNERWQLMSLKPDEGGGWLRRVREHVWAMVAPLFDRQQAFNSAVVDHINRNVVMHREVTGTLAGTLSVLRQELEGLINFQSKLILYAQQITSYVDTKDRYLTGLPHGLAEAISGLSDAQQKRWEATAARERRYEAQVGEVRSTTAVLQGAVQTLKREFERRAAGSEAQVPPAPAAQPASPLDSYKYVVFEDRFRGSQEEIRHRAATYVALFEGARDVLDIGCGRGEFLDLLREQQIPARGVDLNDQMAAICRERGLDVATADALTYLLAQPDGSIGGLFGAQVVEHMKPDYLLRLLEAAYHKLRPGSKIVLETINPTCWYAFFSSFIRDITHEQPLHPETLQYLLVASGFQRVEIRYSAPYPDEAKLQPILLPSQEGEAPDSTLGRPLTEIVTAVNENMERLNRLMFTYLDYAAIGERL